MYTTVILILGLLTVLYFWLKRKYTYWESRGIKQAKGIIPPFGHSLPVATFRIGMGDMYSNAYTAYRDEQVIGMYDLTRPILLVIDPRIVERILVKDFNHFVDRLRPLPERPDSNPMDLGLFSLSGNRWRAVRQKLVPTFTTGKLKSMMPTIEGCARGAVDEIQDDGEDCHLSQVISKFAVNVIGTCVFDMDPTEISKPDSKFRKYSKQLFTMTAVQMIKMFVVANCPWLAVKFNLSFFEEESTEYFCSVVRKAFAEKQQSGDKRSDNFLSLLMQLKNEGSVQFKPKDVNEEDEYLLKDQQVTEKIELTDMLLFGQALQFLTAGFEAISLASVYLAHELSRHQDLQDRLRKEIQSVLEDFGGCMSYEAIRKMKFLHNCILETLRIYPNTKMLFRYCVKDYTLPETGTVIEAGTTLIIPAWSLQNDPRYHHEPEDFNPDRFEEEAQTPCTFLAFGDGPRICIGMRLALLEIKIVIIELLKRYRFEPSPKTVLPIEFSKKDFMMSPINPIYIKLKKV